MSITYSSYSNGTLMLRSALEVDFDAGRTWVNRGISLSDLDAGQINTEHLAPPQMYAWPLYGIKGSWGIMGGLAIGLGQDEHLPQNQAAYHSIFPNHSSGAESIPSLGFRFKKPSGLSARVEAHFQFRFRTLTPEGITYTYPTRCGYFIVVRRALSSGTTTDLLYTRRDISSQVYGNPASWKHGGNLRMMVLETLTSSGEETYDYYVEWRIGAAGTDLHQVGIFKRQTMHRVDWVKQ